MEQAQGNAVVRELARLQHDGHDVAVIDVNGREAFIASQVSAALGYEHANQVHTAITRDLEDEVEEGTDYQVLRGEELALLKQVAPDLVDPRAPSVMVLFEAGVYLVAMRARTEKARAFRRWLAEEVLPSIRRTGGYGRAPGLTAEEVVKIATQAAATAAVAAVDQLFARMGAPTSGAGTDLDSSEDVVRRAREMRHLAYRHRRAGRRLFALQLEERATLLLLDGEQAMAPAEDIALAGLRHLMAEVKTNPDRVQTLDTPSPTVGAWWGRRDAYSLALVATWVDATLRAGGFDPAEQRREWRARLWLHLQDSGRGHTAKTRIGGHALNCIVFPVDILHHLGVL